MTDKQVDVRLAGPGEAVDVCTVLRSAFAEYRTLYTAKAYDATAPTPDQIRDRWGEGPVWVAQMGDRIVGTVAAVLRHPSLHVRSMGILPESRGLGIGRLLLDHVEAFARERGMKRLVLCTTPFLARAIRLYELFGFKQESTGPDDLCGTPLVTMAKQLKPVSSR